MRRRVFEEFGGFLPGNVDACYSFLVVFFNH